MIALLAPSACWQGGDDEEEADSGRDDEPPVLPHPSSLNLRGECDQRDRLGSFVVHHQEDASIVQGEAADGVVPITILTELNSDGDCRLMQRENPPCEPTCAFDQTCDLDGTCIAYPLNQDLGEITVDGLKRAVKLTPSPPGYNYFDTQLPHPAFEPGGTIRLTSTEGYLGELELYGIGVHPLEILDDAWLLPRDQELSLSWSPPPEGARSTVHLVASVDQHGATPVFLICYLPDTGSATISADLVNELLDHGSSGFPSAILTRRTIDSQQVEGKGCIEFIVGAPREGTLRLPGGLP